MDRNDRELRDAAGVGPYAREREKLVPLSTLGKWGVSDGEPDIRGWELRTVSNRQLGTVADLLVDREAGEVVLLDVDLPASDRHTFVPIRLVQIDRTRRLVLMDSADLPVDTTSRDVVEPVVDRPVVDRPVVDRSLADAEAGTVRYPRSDREVIADRARIADDASSVEAREGFIASGPPEPPIVERRRGDRRRIDRMSTDL